jgi:hypothetical protein
MQEAAELEEDLGTDPTLVELHPVEVALKRALDRTAGRGGSQPDLQQLQGRAQAGTAGSQLLTPHPQQQQQWEEEGEEED